MAESASNAFSNSSVNASSGQGTLPGTRPSAEKLRFYINFVAMKQSSCLALRLARGNLGLYHARVIFSVKINAVVYLANILLFVALVIFPFVATEIVYAAIPSGILMLWREVMRANVPLLKLLLKRGKLYIDLAFILLWEIATCLVLADARCVIPSILLVLYLLEMIKDASSMPPKMSSRIYVKFSTSLGVMILAIYMMTGVVQTKKVTVDFRPGVL